jgi:glutamine amidotransferase PdxT
MLGDEVVGVKTGNRLALTFHPELSSDVGFHRWLIETASALTAEA